MGFVAGKLEQRVRKKVVTTSLVYDADANVTQKTVDAPLRHIRMIMKTDS
jgi:hypothetical protein